MMHLFLKCTVQNHIDLIFIRNTSTFKDGTNTSHGRDWQRSRRKCNQAEGYGRSMPTQAVHTSQKWRGAIIKEISMVWKFKIKTFWIRWLLWGWIVNKYKESLSATFRPRFNKRDVEIMQSRLDIYAISMKKFDLSFVTHRVVVIIASFLGQINCISPWSN